MGFLDRLLGRTPEPQVMVNTLRPPRPAPSPDTDQQAVERYRYLLRTAPPEELERAHAEAFERLTPEQRDIVRRDLEGAVPATEAPRSTDPAELARAATRAEMRAPGTLERSFASGPAAPGFGGSFLQTFAAVFIATSVADALFGGYGYPVQPTDPGTTDPGTTDPGTTDASAAEGDTGDWDVSDTASLGDTGDLGGFGDFGDFGGFDI
jgi:hypothetical protein